MKKYHAIPEGCVFPIVLSSTPNPLINDGFVGTCGTGFFVESKGVVYAITARHCVETATNPIYEVLSGILIPNPSSRHKGEDKWLQISGYLAPIDTCPDSDWPKNGTIDVVAIRIHPFDRSNLDEIINASISINDNITRNPVEEIHMENKAIEIKGYPTAGTESEIIYDDKKIISQPCTLYGEGVGMGDRVATFKAKCFPPPLGVSFDGFSGSPVFYVNQVGGSKELFLAGVAITASTTNSIIQFVDIDLVADLIHRDSMNPY